MKKAISLLMIIAMTLSALTFALPASAMEGLPVAEVEAPYFDVKPMIDGIVSEGEWGEPTVWVDQQDAAQVIFPEDNPEASELNTFFYRNPGAAYGYDAEFLNMSYMMWLRWDENYFYIAVKVNDPDEHSLKNGKQDMWDGDAFQARIDPEGYNASCVLGPESYDADYDGKPWSRDDIDNLLFGYVESAGGFAEAWDYVTNKGLTPFSGGTANVAIAPAYGITENGVDYTEDTQNGVTTYEIALPWSYIDSNEHQYSDYSSKNPDGAIGKEYGMSAVVYNSDEANAAGRWKWNAGLSWGSGIINVQQSDYPNTCGGSNKVTLTADKVSEDGTYTGSYLSHEGGYIPYIPTPEYDIAINESRHVGPLTYDSRSDLYRYGSEIRGERAQDDDGNWVIQWNEDDDTESGLNDQNYLSTRNSYYSIGCSYTMEFDIKVTSLWTFEGGYPSTLYSWFGGSSTVDYECGYDFDMGKFIIRETSSDKILAEVKQDFTLNEWHHWVFQYNKETSEMRFYFDPEMKDGRVSPDAVPMFQMRYRYFDCPGKNQCELIFRRLNAQVMMDNVEFYNFVDFTYVPPVEERVFGDANCDDELDMKDVLLIRKAIAGLDNYPSEQGFKNADVVVDDNVDMKDVLLIRRVIAGLALPEYITLDGDFWV